MNWFDAGVNLLDKRFDAVDVIQRALDAGVSRICIITTQPKEWDAAARLYQLFPDVCCYTVGVHPHHAKEITDADLEQLRAAAKKDGVVAIGECGLDFNRNFSPPDVQVQVFRAQLDIAVNLQLPVYLHERDAFAAQTACLEPVLASLVGGIAHCFTGDEQQLHAYLDMGLFIGVTGWACDDKRGDALRAALSHIPLDRVILETDAPYLFPKTLRPRTKNNEPAYLPHIGEQVSKLMEVSLTQLADNSYANTCRLFAQK